MMATKITKEEVRLPRGHYSGPEDKSKLAFVLHHVLSEEECKQYIQKTEKKGYEKALVNMGGGRQQLMQDVRNNYRCIWDTKEEADKIWQRVKPYIPEYFLKRKVICLNERLRFLRYEPVQFFAPHLDGSYIRDNGERSFLTLQMYLNEGFQGGSTTFLKSYEKSDADVEVVPRTGSVLIFQHDILHEGAPLLAGKKYAMRTDVMYEAARTQPDPPPETDIK